MIRTEVVDELTCCLLMRTWWPYSQRYLVVGLIGLVKLVGLALWLGSGFALSKYQPDKDDVKQPPVGWIMGTLRG